MYADRHRSRRSDRSCGPAGQEVNWGGTAPGNLFCDAAHPRPLGFIWAGPMHQVRTVKGYDETFAEGFWYDDNDFFLRLWNSGLNFLFDDTISGTHLHHDRTTLNTPAGQAGIQKNANYMIRKHGTLSPWPSIMKIVQYGEGRTSWSHL